jgi:hypothetical protein
MYNKICRKLNSFEEKLSKCPHGIPKDDWAEYLTYRNKRDTKVLFCCCCFSIVAVFLVLKFSGVADFYCCCFSGVEIFWCC